jgi:hypothetical protein
MSGITIVLNFLDRPHTLGSLYYSQNSLTCMGENVGGVFKFQYHGEAGSKFALGVVLV